MNISACIFDLDGVIVDTARFHYLAWKRLTEELDIPFDEEKNELLKGISRKASLEMILHLANIRLSNDSFEEYLIKKNDWYLEFLDSMDESHILPGVFEFLNELKNANIGIALGSASKNARTVLEILKIEDMFDAVVDGNDVVHSKPDPEVFLKASALLGVMPSSSIVFEDSMKGIEAAIRGNFRTVGIGNQTTLKEAELVIPGFHQFSFSDLKAYFKK